MRAWKQELEREWATKPLVMRPCASVHVCRVSVWSLEQEALGVPVRGVPRHVHGA